MGISMEMKMSYLERKVATLEALLDDERKIFISIYDIFGIGLIGELDEMTMDIDFHRQALIFQQIM